MEAGKEEVGKETIKIKAEETKDPNLAVFNIFREEKMTGA
jgi:hypothetical protein